MQELIRHLLHCNRKQILERSLMHCHAHNVHSIMLLECPGKTIRLFIAEPGHGLWNNCREHFEECQEVSFHAHHCELTLIPIRGEVWNWIIDPCDKEDGVILILPEYKYQSAITGGEIKFVRNGRRRFVQRVFERLPLDSGFYMLGSVIHTVYVPMGKRAAWLALEGREDPTYESLCWSMSALDLEDFSQLYRPMPEAELQRLLFENNL